MIYVMLAGVICYLRMLVLKRDRPDLYNDGLFQVKEFVQDIGLDIDPELIAFLIALLLGWIMLPLFIANRIFKHLTGKNLF